MGGIDELPTDTVEAGEPLLALARELAEETGLTIPDTADADPANQAGRGRKGLIRL